MEGFLENLFLHILNMSITASYITLFVILARFLLKKSPKIFSYALWSVVLFRLICPFSFTSVFSFLHVFGMGSGKMEYIPSEIGTMALPQVNTGIKSMDSTINSSLPAALPEASYNPMQIIIFVLSVLWVIGVAAIFVYSIISYVKLKHKVCTAIRIENNVYETGSISSPFVLGIIKPKIYLPADIDQKQRTYILMHEQTHINRRDHLIKPLAFLSLCLHWFNPLVWISFVLMTKDMEMSCDESVLKKLGTNIKKDYSSSLLSMALNNHRINAIPLAFGESNVKMRIKNILDYKKPGIFLMVMLAAFCTIVIFVCISNPKETDIPATVNPIQTADQLYENRTPYLGNNSKVITLLDTLPLPEGITRSEVQLNTSTKPYSATIHYSTKNDSLVTDKKDFFKISALLMATVDNMDSITHIGHWSNPALSSSQFYYSFTRSEIETVLRCDVREYGKSPKDLSKLMERLDQINLSEKSQTELVPLQAQWTAKQSLGADMAVLDYASDTTVIFHGYFGLYVYDLNTLQIVRSLDLKALKCDATQGDNYCEVSVSEDGSTVQLHPVSSKKMFVYTVSDNNLVEIPYKPLNNPFKGSLVPVEKVIHSDTGKYSYNAVDFKNGEYGLLYTPDGTIGTLTYMRADMLYSLFKVN
ncbi:M56 family metallopeptidase [Aminipila terrae]|uniref:DUF4825 domain-containing protein n=1 Tax=Aminipila terrae TaxID=2697030 RepID=A0A6P1MAJ0_9FIRM|nr:M56 family metallopeptidase [Aminipila terrae]QHI71640.1 DUF4825 domain-containing protein [Aminipila terrae]